jgi:2-polyprenyl-3-methyl-5-hydroxy-6-metoxy-1,4-benzoquinol methylase
METEHLKSRWMHMFNNNMHKFFVNKNVLDIGCLDGYSTNQFLVNNAKNVVGIDIDTAYIERAIKKYPNIVFKLQDAEEINNFEGSDTISCLGLIYCLKDPIQFLKTLATQNKANIIIIETASNNYETYRDKNFCFLNNNIIKKIFLDNGWTISYNEFYSIEELPSSNFSKSISFTDRIILVFERQL